MNEWEELEEKQIESFVEFVMNEFNEDELFEIEMELAIDSFIERVEGVERV